MRLVTDAIFFAAVPVHKYTLLECILCNDERKQGRRHIYGLQRETLHYPSHSCRCMYLPAQSSKLPDTEFNSSIREVDGEAYLNLAVTLGT